MRYMVKEVFQTLSVWALMLQAINTLHRIVVWLCETTISGGQVAIVKIDQWIVYITIGVVKSD